MLREVRVDLCRQKTTTEFHIHFPANRWRRRYRLSTLQHTARGLTNRDETPQHTLPNLLAGLPWHAARAAEAESPTRLNVVWIIGEDASPHLGCYGETTIKTPHIDALARDGIRFANALTTCPVCSPARSALITGMYQTTLGAHQLGQVPIQARAAGKTIEDAKSSRYEFTRRIAVRLLKQLADNR